MAVQQYCLRWNNHQPNFIQVFSTLLHSESLVDVTLAAEGRQLQAHKVVLSACSSYFQSLFTTNPCKHPIVILKDVQYNDLKTMVDFMYYGEVNVSTEQLPQILKTAEMLKIKGLAEMPDNGTVTKSESKSVEHADPNQIASEGIWGNAESQQAAAQQYQQQQQMVQIQQRCSVSPPKSMSPALRRKRVRKSESGSIERQQQQDQQLQQQLQQQQQQQQAQQQQNEQHMHQQEHGTSGQQVDGEQGKILYFPHLNSSTRVLTSTSTLISAQQAISQNVNVSSRKDSTDPEQPQHDSSQESIDESSHQQPNMLKDLQGVTQTVPLDISGSSSISMTQAHQQHGGGQWAIVDTSAYPRFATTSSTGGLSIQQQQQIQAAQQQHHGNTENHSLNTSTSSTSSNGASVQMYQTNSGNYQSQIISVNPNTMVSSYPQSLSTSTSPQAASGTQIVQSVYSQSIKQEESPASTNTASVSTNQTPTTPSTGTTTTKRKRSVNPQGDENFLRALDAVRFGGIGFCKAARMYGVNNRTLWLEYKKRGYPISRPSIKNRIKLEPNMSPAPSSTPNNDENSMENYDSLPATSISMSGGGTSGGGNASGEGNSSGNPLMCPPNVMGFLDTRHVDFSSAAALHPVPRQRYDDGTVINPAAVSLQGLHFNSM